MKVATPEALEFFESGRLWLRNAVQSAELSELAKLFGGSKVPGERLSISASLPESPTWLDLIATHFPGYRPVRLVAFDKSNGNNWGLPWHQDRVLALQEKHQVEGFTNWSRKGGIWHAEPPLTFFQSMIFLRIHIDASTEENGAMEIAVGSHHAGLIPTAKASEVASSLETELLLANPGDIVALSMLTLHRSRPSKVTTNRRTLRLDLANLRLPAPLAWAE